MGEVSYAKAGAADDMALRTGYDLNIALSGSSDNGITYSMGTDIGGGNTIDRNDDFAIDDQDMGSNRSNNDNRLRWFDNHSRARRNRRLV